MKRDFECLAIFEEPNRVRSVDQVGCFFSLFFFGGYGIWIRPFIRNSLRTFIFPFNQLKFFTLIKFGIKS